MEKEIIDIMKSRGLNKIHLESLIDLGDDYDMDGDTFAITCNTIMVENNIVFIYDDNLEKEDGSVDEEDKHILSNLEDGIKKQALWCLNATLEYLYKNKEV